MSLLSVNEAAVLLNVSTSWIRRHLSELPVVPMPGHVVRIDKERLQDMIASGKSLKPREKPMAINRFQRGGVILHKGKKTQTYYGTYRIDNPDGSRMDVQVKLGTIAELPTKSAARKKLAAIIEAAAEPEPEPEKKPEVKTYSTLVEEWKAAEGATLDDSTFDNYSNSLRACVLPTFKDTDIRTIIRKTVQDFLVLQAKKYGQSSLKTMRLVLAMTLGWGEQNGYFHGSPAHPNGWLEGIRIPKKFGGRTVARTELTPEQTLEFVSRMKDPYSTLVLLLASVGLRGEAAIALRPGDLDAENVLRVMQVIYKGRVVPLTDAEQKKHVFPLDAVVHGELIRRMRSLGVGQKWIFRSRANTPIDLGNARRRYLHPTAKAMGIKVGGWHDFRHTLKRQMRRAGVDPVVVRDTLGHSKVEQQEVYDMAQRAEVGDALKLVGKRMLQNVLQNPSVQ
jgi:integrase